MSARHELFGFFNIDKPSGWTSRRVVDHVKRLVRPEKVGHAGTLDPLASGVLVVCIGRATRLVPYLHQLPKSYRGEFLWGRTSETADVDGEVQMVAGVPALNREQLLEVLPRFVGRITQTPPAYSAVKIQGQRAYDLARRGQKPDVKPREVDVHRLELVECDPPRFVLDIDCGTGTYVRSLGRDFARALGNDAVMSALVRERIGPFHRRDAIRPDAIIAESIADAVVPAALAVSHLPNVVCTEAMIERLRHGRAVRCPPECRAHDRETCALIAHDGRLVALGEFHAEVKTVAPRQVFL